MDPEYVLMNETLDVDEFLSDVSMHLRRRDLRMLLGYIGLSGKEVESLLYDCKARTGTERGLLISSTGTVVEGSTFVNFMEQRKKAMQTWWEYSANTKQRNTPSQQKMKVVESSSCALPQIPEHRSDVITNDVNCGTDVVEKTLARFPRISPIHHHNGSGSLAEVANVVEPDAVTLGANEGHQAIQRSVTQNKEQQQDSSTTTVTVSTLDQPNAIPRTPIVQVPYANVMMVDRRPPTSSKDALHSLNTNTVDRSQQTDLVGCDVLSDQVAIYGSTITLEELLRKLWKSLQACGLNRVVDDLQQRWLIRVDVNQGRADMYPKMTWGTPLPPQTPFTYPPYKKIGHLAVMGSTMNIETKAFNYAATEITPRTAKTADNGSIITSRSVPTEASPSRFLPNAIRERLGSRSANSRGLVSVSLDGAPVTSFPSRDSWKLRTDTVRRKGATISIHVAIDDVTLPTQPSAKWGTSLHVTPQQIRERVARVFFTYAVGESRVLCRAVDRIEKIRGLVVESALKRIGGGGNGIDVASSQLVFQCRCLHPETVEQLWLLYQSGQLRENIQAGLVNKGSRQACAVDQLRISVVVTEEEYRRALGLLRRKPMPNTKTGRFYVTSGTGGAVGGNAGLAHAQKQALISVTRYLKLPTAAESRQMQPPPGPPTTSFAINESSQKHTAKPKPRATGNLLHKVLSKELEILRQRLRMCEDEWCEFAANHLSAMLRNASRLMKRRIIGATSEAQRTPRCSSISILRALYKAVKSPKVRTKAAATPRGSQQTSSSQQIHNNIALYPTNVSFSNADLVTTIHDDDEVIKARKQEEKDFLLAYATFTDLLMELSACRSALQDRIIARLTTNPTVAPSKHLYLAKDIYNLMEKWRHILGKEFNFAQDELVQRLSKRILSDEAVTSTFDKETEEQFPGIIALLPTMFHISEQIVTKIKDLIPKAEVQATTRTYTSMATPRGGATNSRHLPIWLSA